MLAVDEIKQNNGSDGKKIKIISWEGGKVGRGEVSRFPPAHLKLTSPKTSTTSCDFAPLNPLKGYCAAQTGV